MDPLITKVKQIFEYLLAVKNMNEQIIRSIKQYEKTWWQTDFPNIEGCYINGNGEIEDAWLEVHKQEIPATPSLPRVLHQWVKKWNDPEQEPQYELIKAGSVVDSGQNQLSKEAFEDDPNRVKEYQDWVREVWRPWASEAGTKKKIQLLYMELFSLHQRFQREGDDIELIWGHGLLSWKLKGEHIQRPLLVTRLELQFDAQKGIFSLIPTSKGTVMETDMLNNLEIPNIQRIQEMGRQLTEFDIDPQDEESIAPLLQEFVHTISSEGKYIGEVSHLEVKVDIPVVSYSPVLLLRNSNGRVWQNELSNILEKLDEGYSVPETIKLLTTEDDEFSNGALSGENQLRWKSVGEELLFPLPSNFEQKIIVQKLATNPGVVVQGPPGTGKSHTIVNLISHLLAHGKRVLVTSEKERALQVLRDKIPEEIQALCVSLLGGDSKSVKELEDSIKSIAENMDRLQPDLLSKNIERRKQDLYETRKMIAKLQHEINKAAELENESLIVDGCQQTPLEIGKWLSSNISHSWLPNKIPLEKECPLSEQELRTLFQLLGTLHKEDIEQLMMVRPKSADIPSPSDFENRVNDIKLLEQKVAEGSKHIKDWNLPTSYPELTPITNQIKMAIQELEQLQDPWCHVIFDEVMKSEKKLQEWNEFVKECRERIERLDQLEKDLIELEIHFPENLNLITSKEDLLELLPKLEGSKGVGWFFKNITGRKFSYLLNGPTLNGLPIRNGGDIKNLIKHLEAKEIKSKLSLKWNRTMAEIEGITIEQSMNRFSMNVELHINKIHSIVHWKTGIIEPLRDLVKMIGVPEPWRWTDKHWFQELLLGIETIEDIQKLEEAKVFIKDTATNLNRGKNISNAHDSWLSLLDACEQMDISHWTKSYLELKRLEDMQEEYLIFSNSIDKLRQIAPAWINQLLENGGKGEQVDFPDDWREAWKWSQLNHWLEIHQEKTNIEEKEQSLELARKTESRIIKELVAESTWLAQIQRTTRAQKASLYAWLNAIKRIGKGTGKYANMYRKEASEEMKTCRGAIPVWIMPIQKVIENIQLSGELFDVVIVDESSQSDLFSLSALLRGKKVVIVGDDNQISPESVGQDIGNVKQLIDRYLTGIPHKNRYEMKTSLYDIASQVFDSKIILKEHFRCVPEIIQFSNDLMYGGQMDPLRLPLAHEKITHPVKTVRVTDGFRVENTSKALNRPEAEAMVQYISECCNDPQFMGKTFGIISLQGHDQARLIEDLLREAIGEEEMINRRLICGDSYSFQGDERDIIFLSMVAAANVRIGALTKRSDMQRFNVAASRARDQMVLFHSVDLKDLNPSCMRYKLLQYCLEPYRVQLQLEEYEHEFDSQFEKDVFTLISARGYRVIPQVKVGTLGKRIDLVVEGMRSRLAVECDGDLWHGLDKWEDDMERQRILERVGWTFWRVRGSAFYRDPEKAMEPLWKRLEEMEIESFDYSDQIENQSAEIQTRNDDVEASDKEATTEQVMASPSLVDSGKKERTRLYKAFQQNEGQPIQRGNVAITSEKVQQLTLEDYEETEIDLVPFLTAQGVEWIDKRLSGGALWVVGGLELSHLMKKLAAKGYTFKFAKAGGKATKKRASWYLSD